MDYLENIIYPPKMDEDDSSSAIGRLKELKTYIVESNEGFHPFSNENISCEIINTGLDDMKILRAFLKNSNMPTTEFFLDTSDERFFILHTNEKSNITSNIIEQLTKDLHHTFDNTWFYSNMLERLAKKQGNSFHGFGISYSEKILGEEETTNEIEDLTLSISGSLAGEMQKLMEGDEKIKRRVAYNKVRVVRGSHNSLQNSVHDDIHNNGYFAVKKGKSVQDHLHLVDIAKEEYANTIEDVEDQRIGLKQIEDRTLVEGKSFDFEFPNPIENIAVFLQKFFSSAYPFKLWGIKTKIYDDYFKIYAIDLHTGSPMDFEIAKDMMRAYLFKGNCGNTMLRLFTNLQLYFDSQTKCPQLN